MNKKQLGLPIAMLLVAIAAWVGVAYLAWSVYTMQANRGTLIRRSEQVATLKTIAARMHAVLQETVADRSALVTASKVDVLSVVNAIESVGMIAKVKLQVNGAQPGPEISGKNGSVSIRPINFAIQTDGSFSSVMYVVQLLEALPFPTTITQLEIARSQLEEQGKNTSAPWHVNISLRLLTTAEISS